MPITRLEITDFRNIVSANIEPASAGFNLLYGHNGSGKTSFLEAIYYLSMGRSFRSLHTERIIRHTRDKFLIFAQNQADAYQSIPIGVERQRQGNLTIRIAGQDAHSAAELADLTPVQLINSSCFSLLEGGPLIRRKYLDWGIFYRNPNFLTLWREVSQLLKQRNAALRHRRSKSEIQSWSHELVAKALALTELRIAYVNELAPLLKNTVAYLLPHFEFEMSYYVGWNKAEEYSAVLSAALDKDMQVGYTQFGPHRADFKIKTAATTAKDILSRGQQKLFVCAMILAQGALLPSSANKKPIYLIDDLPAELDAISRFNLIALLSQQNTQIFVTAVERDAISEGLSELPFKMFHVEHGNITEETRVPQSGVMKREY